VKAIVSDQDNGVLGMTLFFLAHLSIERKPHLALLPSAEFTPDKDSHGAHAVQTLFECFGPRKAGYKSVSIEECRDAARGEQLLDREHRHAVHTVVA
jgi:hypothetical protein